MISRQSTISKGKISISNTRFPTSFSWLSIRFAISRQETRPRVESGALIGIVSYRHASLV